MAEGSTQVALGGSQADPNSFASRPSERQLPAAAAGLFVFCWFFRTRPPGPAWVVSRQWRQSDVPDFWASALGGARSTQPGYSKEASLGHHGKGVSSSAGRKRLNLA